MKLIKKGANLPNQFCEWVSLCLFILKSFSRKGFYFLRIFLIGFVNIKWYQELEGSNLPWSCSLSSREVFFNSEFEAHSWFKVFASWSLYFLHCWIFRVNIYHVLKFSLKFHQLVKLLYPFSSLGYARNFLSIYEMGIMLMLS